MRHPRSKLRRRARFSGVRLVILTLALALMASLLACQRQEPLPVLWPTARFQLTTQHGQAFGSDDLAGRAAVVSFIYTTCPDICPLLSATFAELQKELRQASLLGDKVRLVSISVDPERDTPEVLAAYAGKFGADPSAWHFLTGDPDQVFETLFEFKVSTADAARQYAAMDIIPHANRILVVDPEGQVRATLVGDETTAGELLGLVRRALAR